MGTVHAKAIAVRLEKDVVDRCAGEIRKDIIAGLYKPGDELPTAARLAQVYGVSRPVVDHALQVLCARNTIHRAENLADARQIFKVAVEPPRGGESDVLTVKYLTVEEVAATIRVSKMTVYRLVHEKAIEAKRIGRSFRIPEHAVREFLDYCSDS